MPQALMRSADLKRGGFSGNAGARWRKDARTFVKEVLRYEPDVWQDQFLAAISGITEPGMSPASPRLALKACKGPGKSFILACAIWWWMATRWHCNIVVLSITADNLRDNLWSELARVYERSWLLQQFFDFTSERIAAKGKLGRTWWCSARSFPQNADQTQQANTLAGLHGRHPAVFCDEVGDYPDGVVVAAEAIFANDASSQPGFDARLVIAGNPTNTDGPLYRVCTSSRSLWWVKEITGDPDAPDRAKRISVEWARQQIAQWGRDNDWVKVNVFGQFPSQQSNKLLGPEEVREAVGREPPDSYRQDPIIMAMDVARYGDNESVLLKRQGLVAFRARTWRETDLMTLADQVVQELINEKPDAFICDQTGVGGGLADRVKQLGQPVIGIDPGGSPMDERFHDRRAEMWWKMRDWVRGGGCIPDDGSLRRDLITPNFSYEVRGKQTKFMLESKKDMRKRGVASPDRGDALAMTFAVPVMAARKRLEDQLYERLAPHVAQGRLRGGTEDDWNPLGD